MLPYQEQYIKNTEEIDLTFTYDEFYADGYEHPFVKEPEDILLIVDENTVFDPSCETGFFTNYEEGDTPLEWLRRNVQNIENLWVLLVGLSVIRASLNYLLEGRMTWKK